MGKFRELMQRKILGIKVLYLVAAFVVALLLVAWKMKSAPDAEDEVPGEDEDDAGADDPLAPIERYPDTDGDGTVTTPVATPETPTTPVYDVPVEATNETWARTAISWLRQNGGTPESAATAIQKYLAGDALSYAEGQLRDKAINQFGYPPDIPISGGTQNKPVTTAKPPTVTPQTQKPPLVFNTTASINTFGEMAKKFYGSNADRYIDLIQAANTSKPHAGPFKVGTPFFIPAKREPKYYTAKRGYLTAASIAAANGISQASLKELNDNMKFPVTAGKKVRVA